MGSVVSDYPVMVAAREVAQEIVAKDPELKADQLADLKHVLEYNKLVQARS